MAEMKVTSRASDLGFGAVDNYTHHLAHHTETSATLKADKPGPSFECRIVLEGRDFEYSRGKLVAGTVTKVTYEDFDGANLAVISDLKVKAKGLTDLLGGHAEQFEEPLLAGDDHIRGSSERDQLSGRGGNDTLFGGKGDDMLGGSSGRNTLTGGKGNDYFEIDPDARNTITDFDATGHDTIVVYGFDWEPEITQDGADTVVDFGYGALRLLDVEAATLNADNFKIMPGTVE